MGLFKPVMPAVPKVLILCLTFSFNKCLQYITDLELNGISVLNGASEDSGISHPYCNKKRLCNVNFGI